MVASAEFTGSFTCYWDQGANTLDCGGVQCRAGSSLRAVSSAGAMVNADGGSFSGVYTCDNGCTITALVDGSGGWDCGPDEWWSGGDGGGGSGGGGGGGSGGAGGGPDWTLGNDGNTFGYDAPPSLDDDAEMWSKWAHEYFIDAAFKGNSCPRIVSLLKGSSLETDILFNGSSANDVVRHAMRTPQQTPTTANQLIDQFISDQLGEAHGALEGGNNAHGIWVLGRALHAMIDRTSPAHTDYLGRPQVWPIPDGEPNHHSPTTLQGRENVRNITPLLAETNRTNLIGAMQSVFEGITPRPGCAAFN